MTDQQFVTNTILEKYRAKGNKNKNDEEKDDDLVIGSPLSTISSPLAATRTQTNTISSSKDSNTGDDVYERTLIGNRVAAVLGDELTHFGTILSSHILSDGKTYWRIVYDDNFDEEDADAIQLFDRQDLYQTEGKNDIVWQQKQKTRATVDDDVELSVLSSSSNNTNNNSRDDAKNDNNDDDDDDDDEGPPVDIEYFDEILYEVSKDSYYKDKMTNVLKE